MERVVQQVGARAVAARASGARGARVASFVGSIAMGVVVVGSVAGTDAIARGVALGVEASLAPSGVRVERRRARRQGGHRQEGCKQVPRTRG
jgi:hypothetical protein